MSWYDADNVQYNRFVNLDSIEDRIIYYLISEEGKNEEQLRLVHTIWRILKYADEFCLINDEEHPLPSYKEIAKLIDSNAANQSMKRIFRYPFVEDAFTDECSMIRIYVDSISPDNHIIATVNVGVEVITHNKASNIVNPLYDDNGDIINKTEENPIVAYKNRCVTLLKCVLALLNGADVAGVGKMQFNTQVNRFNQARLGVWNNRNYYGYKNILSVHMSGVA